MSTLFLESASSFNVGPSFETFDESMLTLIRLTEQSETLEESMLLGDFQIYSSVQNGSLNEAEEGEAKKGFIRTIIAKIIAFINSIIEFFKKLFGFGKKKAQTTKEKLVAVQKAQKSGDTLALPHKGSDTKALGAPSSHGSEITPHNDTKTDSAAPKDTIKVAKGLADALEKGFDAVNEYLDTLTKIVSSTINTSSFEEITAELSHARNEYKNNFPNIHKILSSGEFEYVNLGRTIGLCIEFSNFQTKYEKTIPMLERLKQKTTESGKAAETSKDPEQVKKTGELTKKVTAVLKYAKTAGGGLSGLSSGVSALAAHA